METVGLYEIGVYIACQQNMVKQYIVTCPIMCLCLVEERRPGMKLLWRWWEQTNLDILGTREGDKSEDMGVTRARRNQTYIENMISKYRRGKNKQLEEP